VVSCAIVASFGFRHQGERPGMNYQEVQQEWEAFKLRFGKTYASQQEEQKRFFIFAQNLKELPDRRARASPLVKLGVTQFYDFTREEWKQRYLYPMGPAKNPAQSGTPKFPNLPVPTWDWSAKGAVTAIKNEEQCGSTWAMAAIDTLESVCKIAGFPLTSLSTQQVVDCDTNGQDQGCNGGFPEGAYQYIINAGGIETESGYPYKGQDNTCQADKTHFVPCKMASYKTVPVQAGEQNMVQWVYTQSPIVVCLAAGENAFYDYTGGIITSQDCPPEQASHCVELVGWVAMDGTSAWKMKNQWGTSWGADGYVYLQMGNNTCGMDCSFNCAPCVGSIC